MEPESNSITKTRITGPSTYRTDPVTYLTNDPFPQPRLILLCDYNFVGVENYNWTLKRDGDGFLDGVTITVRTEAACAIEVPTSGGTIFMLMYVPLTSYPKRAILTFSL
jgi:hypothetical protein